MLCAAKEGREHQNDNQLTIDKQTNVVRIVRI